MKKIIYALVACVLTCPTYADDADVDVAETDVVATPAVVERTSCADVQSKINTLATRDDLTDDETTELDELRAKYRRDCSRRAGGRGTRAAAMLRTPVATQSPRAMPAPDAASAAPKTDVTPENPAAPCDVPDEHGCCPGETYTDMGDAGFNCCPAGGGMCFTPMVLKQSTTDSAADKKSEKTDAEIAAEIDANIAAGLCGDGTKPNKFGCCADELFKDLGGTFACCPKSGGDCLPPITKKSDQ